MAGQRITQKSKDQFAKLLRAWRSRLELTQADAAERLGVPLRTLQGWEVARVAPRGYGRTALEKILKVK
jgi:DNA-binding transcriptional regulator YiaG